MENLGIVVGIALGLFGSVFSVYQYIKEIGYRKKLEEDKKRLEEVQNELLLKKELDDRLYFLANVIINKDIPRKSRQPFYDEYIAKGGHGSFVKFWLEEEPKE
jgi:hypothetical protein